MQLIDLGQSVKYIPIDVSKVPYTFSAKLDDKTYSFLIRYNGEGKLKQKVDFLQQTSQLLPQESGFAMGIQFDTAGHCSDRWKMTGIRCLLSFRCV